MMKGSRGEKSAWSIVPLGPIFFFRDTWNQLLEFGSAIMALIMAQKILIIIDDHLFFIFIFKKKRIRTKANLTLA